MIKVIAPALIIATMAVGPASAGFVTGNQLLDDCRRPARMFAMGYVSGLADMLQTIVPEKMCIPEEASIGQAVDIVCKHVEDNPQLRHGPADYLTFSALYKVFACKQ